MESPSTSRVIVHPAIVCTSNRSPQQRIVTGEQQHYRERSLRAEFEEIALRGTQCFCVLLFACGVLVTCLAKLRIIDVEDGRDGLLMMQIAVAFAFAAAAVRVFRRCRRSRSLPA
ncbi:hypothetical protein MRX96_000556 [Rhipicephalus microplus]